MYTILIAIVSGLVAGEGSYLLINAALGHAKVWEAIALGITVAVVVAVVLLRRAGTRLEPVMKNVEKHVAGGRRELALKTLRESLTLGKWNPLLPGQLNTQIGILEYVAGDLDAAETALARASKYPWQSRAYLACVHFKRKNEDKMKKAFDQAIKQAEKEGVAYTLYAYCLLAQNKKADAVKVLEDGLKKIPGDHRLENNLELAKEGKKLKVAPYGDEFSRFLLEGPPSANIPNLPKGMRGYAVRPGFRQRPQRRK
jgi:tetratricopeptide (TPR) repeat protein